MEGDLKGALEAYLHADLLNSESKWVIRRIAGCYRSLKQPEEALKYYRRYEALNPDNLSVQISIGHCHLELKDASSKSIIWIAKATRHGDLSHGALS